MNIQDWFPLGLICLISSQSKGLSRVFSNTTVQKHQFFSVQLSLWYSSHIHTSQVVLVVKNPPDNAEDIRDMGSIPGLGRSPGEGNGNPLWYSCLENSMNGGAWWAMVHQVTKSRTQPSDWVCKEEKEIRKQVKRWFQGRGDACLDCKTEKVGGGEKCQRCHLEFRLEELVIDWLCVGLEGTSGNVVINDDPEVLAWVSGKKLVVLTELTD